MISLLCLVAVSSPAPSLFAQVDAKVAELRHQRGFVGASVAVMQDGKIVYTKGVGKTRLGGGRAVRPVDRFSIGSVTKEFTAACAMKLVEEGKLSLDDPVSKYLPAVSNGDRITVRQLMQHLSGLRDYYPLDYLDKEMRLPTTAASIVAKYGSMPLDFEPGARFSYTNTGYAALGLVIEKIEGRPLAQVMQGRIFRPLKLSHTTFEVRPTNAPGVVQGYETLGLEGPAPTAGEADNWCGAAGAIATTASDLALWDWALMSGKVLRIESLAQMTTAAQDASGSSTGYGFGLGVGTISGEPFWEHGGGTNGFLSENIMLPSRRSAVVVLSNSTQVSPSDTGWGVAGLLTGKGRGPDAAPKSTAKTAKTPKVAGPEPEVATRALLISLRAGRIDPDTLTEDFQAYLSPARRKRIAKYLGTLGKIGTVTTRGKFERGGMEVAALSIALGSSKHVALMYRETNGRIAELYLVN